MTQPIPNTGRPDARNGDDDHPDPATPAPPPAPGCGLRPAPRPDGILRPVRPARPRGYPTRPAAPDLNAELAAARQRALEALGGYKFWMFGYHAAQWVLLNRLAGRRNRNPFAFLVRAARAELRAGPAARPAGRVTRL